MPTESFNLTQFICEYEQAELPVNDELNTRALVDTPAHVDNERRA